MAKVGNLLMPYDLTTFDLGDMLKAIGKRRGRCTVFALIANKDQCRLEERSGFFS